MLRLTLNDPTTVRDRRTTTRFMIQVSLQYLQNRSEPVYLPIIVFIIIIIIIIIEIIPH